jgi:N,N'-diacetyllegionaminate synthase
MSTPSTKAPTGIDVGGRRIGSGHPCFVIAEAGVNHGGDVAIAHRLVDAAADAGADAVKFQTFEPALLASAEAPRAAYQEAADGGRRSQLEMLAALALPREAHRALQQHAQDRGIVFLSSPFDEASLDFLAALGVPAFKIPSGELTNHPLLAHAAGKGRPVLLSTGMSDLAEVAQARAVLSTHGDPALVLFQCVSCYPADPTDANLAAMETMRRAFGVPIGFSDHTEGIDVALAAVACGACALEKHLTLDRAAPGPDHASSLEPQDLRALVRSVRRVESARGDGIKAPRPAEEPIARVARKSLHWSAPLPAGAIVEARHLVALRPGTGIPPSAVASVIGRVVARPATAGTPVREDQLESAPAHRRP